MSAPDDQLVQDIKRIAMRLATAGFVVGWIAGAGTVALLWWAL